MRFISMACTLLAAQAHICIMQPHQRGDMNISTPANDACFRRYPGCGGIAAGAPTATFTAGQNSLVHFQQNLNHWNDDKPGKLELSVSYDDENTWMLLRKIGDFPGNDMIQQTNFSVHVSFPKAAEKAVLQLKYTSYNKYEVYPANNTDAIFYQCSDIVIKEGNQTAEVNEPTAVTASAAECVAPPKFMAKSESERQTTEIWYDATVPIVRWDRTDRFTGVKTTFVTNYTVVKAGDPITEFGFNVDSKTCTSYGADAFYQWAYKSSGEAACIDDGDLVKCEAQGGGVQWAGKRHGSTCLPQFINKEFEKINFVWSQAVESIDSSVFQIPDYCKTASVEKISCHH